MVNQFSVLPGDKLHWKQTKKNRCVSGSPPINSERFVKEKNQPKLMSVFQSAGKILRKGREFIVWNKWLKIFKDIHKNLNERNNEAVPWKFLWYYFSSSLIQ